MFPNPHFQTDNDTLTSLQSLALSAGILNSNYLTGLQNIQSQFQLPYQPFPQMQMIGMNPMLVPQLAMYNYQHINQNFLGIYPPANPMPGTNLQSNRPEPSHDALGPFQSSSSLWPPMPDVRMPQGDPSTAAMHHSSSFPISQPKSEPESEAEQVEESRRSRGRPRGAKDKKPRKRRRAAEGVAADAGSTGGHTSSPPGEGGADVAHGRGEGGPGSQPASPTADKSGRRKPWKIVLTSEDAVGIYRARATGKTAAAVCARLAETYSVHAKVTSAPPPPGPRPHTAAQGALFACARERGAGSLRLGAVYDVAAATKGCDGRPNATVGSSGSREGTGLERGRGAEGGDVGVPAQERAGARGAEGRRVEGALFGPAGPERGRAGGGTGEALAGTARGPGGGGGEGVSPWRGAREGCKGRILLPPLPPLFDRRPRAADDHRIRDRSCDLSFSLSFSPTLSLTQTFSEYAPPPPSLNHPLLLSLSLSLSRSLLRADDPGHLEPGDLGQDHPAPLDRLGASALPRRPLRPRQRRRRRRRRRRGGRPRRLGRRRRQQQRGGGAVRAGGGGRRRGTAQQAGVGG